MCSLPRDALRRIFAGGATRWIMLIIHFSWLRVWIRTKFQGYAYHHIFQCSAGADLGSGLYIFQTKNLEFRHLVLQLYPRLARNLARNYLPARAGDFSDLAICSYQLLDRGPPLLSLAITITHRMFICSWVFYNCKQKLYTIVDITAPILCYYNLCTY